MLTKKIRETIKTHYKMTQVQKTTKELLGRNDVKKKFEEMLGKRATSFLTSVLQIVSSNQLLSNSTPESIYHAAVTAATLDLPLNNNLGFAYIIPFKVKGVDVAQFQIGYKGFIQLAQRSGQFNKINAAPIYEGQIISSNPLTGFEFDFDKKTSDVVIGYAAYFKLLNGYEQTLYMTVDQLRAHGMKFSKSYQKGYGLWKDDFHSMAQKTVLKLMLAKYAPLSVDMVHSAIKVDQAVINDSETEDVTYIDIEEPTINKEEERIGLMIEDCTSLADLKKLEKNVPQEMMDYYLSKEIELKAKEEKK